VVEHEGLDFEEIEPGRILGTMTINHIWFHVEGIRVKESDENGQQFDGPDERDSSGPTVLDNMFAFDQEGPFQTIEIEGFPGDWVLFITPFKS